MNKGVCMTGIPSLSELRASPGVPGAARMSQGPIAVIECVQEIPCNPCEWACPLGAIRVGSPITNLPEIDESICIGCGSCVAHCPGLAIFLVDVTYSATEAEVSFPYEYCPLPQQGEQVLAVNRAGESVCAGIVSRIRMPEAFKQTCVVSVVISKEFSNEVRSMRLIEKEQELVATKKVLNWDDDPIICRCQEVTRSQVEQAIREGAITVDGVKKRTRAGMGLCQGKTCERLVARIICDMTGQNPADVLPATYRPPVRPVRMGTIGGGANEA